jgi:hypothetical protein
MALFIFTWQEIINSTAGIEANSEIEAEKKFRTTNYIKYKLKDNSLRIKRV